MDINLGYIISAFIAGILIFFAPCTFPLVPAYLGLISGTSDISSENIAIKRRTIIRNGLFFVLGFTVVFMVLGLFAGLLGQLLTTGYRIWMERIGGVLIIVFALMMLGIITPKFLQQNLKIKLPKSMTTGTPSSSFLIGFVLAFGWTPCVGPILGSILTLAVNSATALQGGFLLLIFSLGLALPFLLLAIGFGSALKWLTRLKRVVRWISILGGIVMLIVGILLLTDNFGLLIQYGYGFFKFLNYDKLMNYL